MFIYVLLLEGNKYYIGKTKNPKIRVNDHFNRNGSYWTKLHPPKNVIEVTPLSDSFDEDKYTLKYMVKHGIDNVRGGSFSQIKLSSNDLLTINKLIATMSDKPICFNCNEMGHFIKDCNKPSLINQYKTDEELMIDRIYNRIDQLGNKDERIIKIIYPPNYNGKITTYIYMISNYKNLYVYSASCFDVRTKQYFKGYMDNTTKLSDIMVEIISEYNFEYDHYSKIKITLDNVIRSSQTIIDKAIKYYVTSEMTIS